MKYNLQKITECTNKEVCGVAAHKVGDAWSMSFDDLNNVSKLAERWNNDANCKCQWKVVESSE